MKLLTNPLFMRGAAVFLLGVAAFVVGIVVTRILRRQLVEGESVPENPGNDDSLYPYTAVIQQLKQQKFELQSEQQAQRRRAKTSELISSAVIANLPCGILFFGTNGLVKQANATARRILGFASPLGMGLDELFRGAKCVFDSGEELQLAEAFKNALTGKLPPALEAHYSTAAGKELVLGITLIPLSAPSGESLGIASVITDETPSADSRRARLLHSEISAEMALELRNSLAAIRQCAEQMGRSGDSKSFASMAKDISFETERLDKLVGGFLAGNAQAKTSAAGA